MTAALRGTSAGEVREPIAIVGLGCRFPHAADPHEFWQLLLAAGDGVGEVPPGRFTSARFVDDEAADGAPAMSRFGGYLDAIDGFDWRAFRISPREAKFADPQHRLLLEVSWEALEDAGLPLERVAGSRTGVYIGIMWPDYAKLQSADYANLEGYSANGNSFAYAANRISYFYDLKGPSMAVDVQCASSLTSVHLACQALWAGEADAALAGGVNLIVSPDTNIAMWRASILSPDGRCKTWDASANGFVRGEGAGLVVLKRLAEAVADGDRIYAVVRSSVISHGGKTDWIMAPSRVAQEALLREAYDRAGLDPRDVDYVEIHGTGTSVGDPIEAAALGAVVGAGRRDRPCKVGTVKTNIGHLDSAAGVAGLIKASLSLHHGQIPPNLHFREVNPTIPLEELGLEVQTEPTPWPSPAGERVAGVTALSFGGGHAHVVLADAPRAIDGDAEVAPARPYLLPLSGRSEEALRLLARSYHGFLSPGGPGADASLADVCWTASLRRTHHEHRAAIVARTREGLLERLDALAQGESRSGLVVGRVAAEPVRPVLVFAGQGRPWWATGRELLETEPAFRAAVTACDRRIRAHARWSLLDELTRDETTSRVEKASFAEPAMFALQLGLVELWRSWGVEPAAVVGHSVGEIGAAWCAGVLAEQDAVRLAVQRGRVMDEAHGTPAMAVVLLPRADTEALLAPGEGIEVAAENAPAATVVAGSAAALDTLVARCAERGVYAARLDEDEVFHRAPPGPEADELAALVGELATAPAGIPLFSTALGTPADAPDLGVDYWVRQMSEPVRFRSALDSALDLGYDTFVEVGAHPALIGAIQEGMRVREVDGVAVSALRRGRSEQETMLSALAALHVRGYPVDLRAVQPGLGRCVSLPTHPWLRESVWIARPEPTAESVGGVAGTPTSSHPLLGVHLRLAASAEHLWESTFDSQRMRYLDDHKVQGVTVVAGATYVEMAVAAAGEAFGWSDLVLSDIELRQALVVPAGGRRVQLLLQPGPGGRALFRVFSRPADAAGEGSWTLHVTGAIAEAPGETAETAEAAEAADWDLRQGRNEALEGSECYRYFEERGEQYGPAFQGIARLWRREGEALAQQRAPAEIVSELPSFRFHPALLDAYMHTLVMAAPAEGSGGFMPVRIDEIRVTGRLDAEGWSHVRLVSGAELDDGRVEANIRALDADGRVQMAITGLHLQYLDPAALQAPLRERWYYEVAWEPEPESGEPAPTGGDWLVVSDRAGVGAALHALLEGAGERVELVDADDADGLGAAFAELGQPAHVVHLGNLDAAAPDTAGTEAVDEARRRGSESALRLVHALAGGEHGRPSVWLVTQGAQAVEGAPVNPLQAPTWGFGRSLAQEHAELWGGLFDLDPAAAPEDSARAITARVRSGSREDQCATRGGRDYVARLVPVRVPASPESLTWPADAAYLVTGGLGDLGLAVARWLAEQGARRLILMGRTPLPPRATWQDLAEDDSLAAARVAAVRELEALGASVHVAAVDVGDEKGLTAFLEEYEREGWPRIRGVVHAAGVAPFEAIEQITPESLASVLRPKVDGGWLLHRLLPAGQLDFFVLFASASGVLSSPRLSHYAAGNAFLDSLAHYRRDRGETALSIAWGPWADVGMATRTGSGGPASLRGMSLIPLDDGLDAMERLMLRGSVSTGVLPIEWEEWRLAYSALARAPLMTRVAGADADETADVAEEEEGGQARLLVAPAEERRALVEALVTSSVADILRVPADQLAGGQSFAALGFDSLMAIELRTRLQALAGVDVAILEIVDADETDELVGLVLRQLDQLAAVAADPFAEPLGERDARAGDADMSWVVEDLSDAEVEALLADLEAVAGG